MAFMNHSDVLARKISREFALKHGDRLLNVGGMTLRVWESDGHVGIAVERGNNRNGVIGYPNPVRASLSD
jgi:hypothetical protein